MHLRVWWKQDISDSFFKTEEVEMSGIVVGSWGHFESNFTVRADDGEFWDVEAGETTKSKWVSHPDDGGLE